VAISIETTDVTAHQIETCIAISVRSQSGYYSDSSLIRFMIVARNGISVAESLAGRPLDGRNERLDGSGADYQPNSRSNDTVFVCQETI